MARWLGLRALGLALAAGLVCWGGVEAAAAFQADGKVHDLTTSSFDTAIKSHPLAFVEFYAPWCGHCKKLAPEWEKTAELAKEAAVPVAKVDAIAEKKIAQENGVESFPTLKLYRADPKVSKTYNGQRTAEKMAEWLSLWKGAELLEELEASGSKIRKWAGQKSIAVVGILGGKDAAADAAMREVLEAASFALNPQSPGAEVPVGQAPASALAGIGLAAQAAPCIVLLRNFDFEEKVLVYTPKKAGAWKGGYGAFMDWLKAKRVPTLIPAQKDTEQFFLTDIDPGNGLAMLFGGAEALRKDMHELAVRFSAEEKRLKWVHAKSDDFGEALGKNVGMEKADFPDVVIWEFGETEEQDKTFRLSQQTDGAEATKASVEDFVERWRAGELSAEKDPVLAVTSDSFDEVVIESKKDVLVEFYAPWCGHCKSLAPEYKQLALHYASDSGIAIVKMDATKHKHDSAKIEGYPTLKFYTVGAKDSPKDPGFKAGRDKQSLVEFIEKNRVTPAKGTKGSKKSDKKEKKENKDKTEKKEKAQPAPAPTPQKTAKVPEGEAMVRGAGVWIFDDAAEPETRGKQLSADMVGSRSGFTLVQVGGLGLLLSPGSNSAARAVRQFETEAKAAEYVRRTSQPEGVSEPAIGRLPCPVRADLTSCKAWCEGVAAGPPAEIKPTLGGKSCAELPKDKTEHHDNPACMCYDSDYKALQAMCLSPCSESGGDGGSSETFAAGDASCAAGASESLDGVESTRAETGGVPAKRRFFLYDTKYGEGFNLQREVYPRAGWIVAELNKALEANCGADKTEGKCARWTLVLPPWCRVVHWWSGPEKLPWSTFFDADVLKKAKTPVIEFEEYVKLVGGQTVDLAVTYQTDKLEGSAKAKLKGAHEGFFGWAEQVEHCSSKYQKTPEFQKLPSGELSMVYAGQCEGGIRAKQLRCAALDGPWPKGVVDMLQTLGASTSSVLMKGYDYLLSPDAEELDALGLRESMLFSKEIRSHGEDFIKKALGGKKYLAAHCRRTDFLRVRTKTTPTADVVAGKLNALLEETGFEQVFVATDAPTDLREDLQRQVKARVHFYDGASGAATFEHPGKQAAVEIWIAARADFFIGTIESRFTMWIQLERGFQGKLKATSEQEFCKEYTKGPGQKCLAPHYRQPARLGAFREAYQS